MSFTYNSREEEEMFMSFCGLIKNNGFFKSEKQAKFMTKTYGIKDSLSPDVCNGIVLEAGQKIITIEASMRWTDYGARSVIPVSFLFIMDKTGVIARYKLPYNGNLRDGARPAWDRLQLQWKRPEDAVVPEFLTVAPEAAVMPESKSNFIREGDVGVRIQLKGVVKSVRTFATAARLHYYDSGVRTVTTVVCGDDVVTYFNALGDAEVGDEVEFTAALKDWSVYNGVKQTTVGRATKIVVKKAVAA